MGEVNVVSEARIKSTIAECFAFIAMMVGGKIEVTIEIEKPVLDAVVAMRLSADLSKRQLDEAVLKLMQGMPHVNAVADKLR